jgi:hypothetical protein
MMRLARSFNKSLTYLAAVTTTAIFIMTIGLTAQRSWFQTTAKATRAVKGEHKLYFPYYTIHGQWDSLLTLNNASRRPLEVALKAYSLEGKPLALPDQTLQPLAHTRLRLADLIGEVNMPKFKEGSLELSFDSERPTALGPQLTVINEHKNLSFDMEPPMGQKTSKLEGVWWSIGDKTEANVIVSNTKEQPLNVQINLDLNAASVPVTSLTLSAHQTAVLDVEKLLKEAGHTYKEIATGGISISHNGDPDALAAHGFIVDREKGVCSSLHMTDPATMKSSNWDGTGFPIGRYALTEQDDKGTLFKPILVLKNITESMQQATVTVQYTIGDEMKIEALPVATIAPREVRTVDFRPILRSLGRSVVKDAGVRVDMNGQQGALTGELVSMSDEGICINVPLLSVSPRTFRSGAHPFSLDGDSQAVLHLKNTGDKPTEAIVHVLHEAGDYALDLVKIRPGESVALDIRKLANSGKQDIHGNIFPVNIVKGQVTWVQHGDQTLIGRLIQFSPSQKSAANFSCGGSCDCGPVFERAEFSPSEIDGSPADENDGTSQTDVHIFDYDYWPYCPDYGEEGPFDIPATLSAQDPSVASVDPATHQATLVGPGDTQLRAVWNEIISYSIDPDTEDPCHPDVSVISAFMTVRSTTIRLENEAGNNLDKTNQNAIVGEHIRLFLHTIPARSFTNLNWSITGTHKKEWNVTWSGPSSPNSTAAYVSTVTNDTPVNFFWHDGDFNGKAETVTMTLKINDKLRQRAVNYHVFHPLVDVTATKGTIAVGSGYDPLHPGDLYLHYGIPVAAPGLDMAANNITIPLGLMGQWQWVQTVAADRTSGTLHDSGFGLDHFYPAATGLNFEDSPAQQLTSGGTDVTYSPTIGNDAYDTYLMFMPNLPNAHWVPMKKVHWNWFGTATESFFGSWSLESSGTGTVTVSNQVDFPTWSMNHITNFR